MPDDKMKTRPSRTMGGKATNWGKNFGKSLKYSSVDILKELAPNMFNTSANARTAVQELTQDIRDMKTLQKRTMSFLETIPLLREAKTGIKNAVRDIKSGKINNQERLERLAAKDAMSGFEDEDFEFSVDDDNMEFDAGSEDEFSVSEDVNAGVEPAIAKVEPGINATANATRHTAIAAENVAVGINKQTGTIVDSLGKSVDVNKQIALAGFTLNQKFHENTMEGFRAINENLSKLVAFNDESISKLAMGALKYYEDDLAVSNNILAELQKISAKVAPDKPEEEEKEEPQFRQLFTGSGVMKFNKYPEILKKNFMAAVDSDPILSAAKQFLFDEDAIKAMMANPLQALSTKIVTNFIPTMIKDSLKSLDNIVGAFFPAVFERLTSMQESSNPIKQMLGKIFGLDIDIRENARLADYEKNAVPFDGITHTTINTVIPEYLAGILAAVSNKEQLAFDYDNFNFTTKRAMRDQIDEELNQAYTSGYSKVMAEAQKIVNAGFTFKDELLEKNFWEEFQDFFRQVTEQGVPDFTKETFQKYGISAGANEEIMQTVWNVLPKELKMQLAKGRFNSGLSVNDYYNDNEENKGKRQNQKQVLSFNPQANSHMEQEDEMGYNWVSKRKEEQDWRAGTEYAKSQTDLLLDIKNVLLEGIIVFPKASMSGESNVGGIITGTTRTVESRLKEQQKEMDRAKREKEEHEESLQPTKKDTETLKEKQDKGGLVVEHDLRGLTQDQINEIVRNKTLGTRDANKNKMGGWYEQFDKWINESTFGQKIVDIRKYIDKIFRTPSEFIRDSLDKVSNTLYALIYGDDDKKSFIDLAKEKMTETFEKFNNWLKKKWNSATNYLFGEGGLTETKTFKWVKGKSEKLFDLLFGKKNAQGKRENGAFSEAFNSISDVFLNVRGELFGTPYTDSKGIKHAENKNSVVHELKAGVSSAFDQMTKYLFGEPKKDKNGKEMSFLDQLTDTLATGFNNWSNFLFGTKRTEAEGRTTFKEITEDFKKHLPKALAIGIVGAGVGLFTNFGLLGSLFLPGGPVGGAILGVSAGLLGQSEKFKNFLFGPKGADGLRAGGIISKSVQSWVIKHKTAILGGATFGAVKGIIGTFLPSVGGPLGFVGSFLLPGGPITGALMGAAIGIGWKSKTFQEFLYGKEKDGKKTGGILASETAKSMKKHLPNMAFGALSFGAAATVIGQMGYMGAMLTPMGPLGAAIMGAATGIAISSDKFRKFLFGEKDEKTGFKKAGLFNKLSNVFSLSIVEPFKIKMNEISFGIKHWFEKDIANRVRASLDPIKVQMKLIGKDIQKLFSRGWNYLVDTINTVFEKSVGLPLGKFIEERVLKPMRSFMSKLVGGIGKIFGAIISSPFKAMHMMTNAMLNSQTERGIKESREERREAFKESVSDLGSLLKSKAKNFIGTASSEEKEKAKSMSIFSAAKTVLSIGKDNVTQYTGEKTKEDGKKYIDADAIRDEKEKLDKESDEKYEAAMKELQVRKLSLKMRREVASKNNFDTVARDKDGNIIGDLNNLYNLEVPLDEIDLHTKEQTGILQSIKTKLGQLFMSSEKANMIAAAMAYHETGNKSFIDMAENDAGKVADKVPSDLKDSKVAENVKDKEENEQTVAEQEAKNAKEQQAAEEAGQPASQDKTKRPSLRDLTNVSKGKFKITEENILNMISAIPENASETVKAYYEKAIDRMMRMFSSKSNEAKPENKTESPGTVSNTQSTQSTTSSTSNISGTTQQTAQSKESGSVLDNILNQLKVNTDLQLSLLQQNQQKSEPAKVSASDSKTEREFDSKNKVVKGSDPSLKYLRIIASNVDGQLNGVGSNVYKSRKLLESISGISSDDITGSNNKDRVTFFGKARRMITMMVFHPLEFIGSVVMKPFQVIANIGQKIWNTAWNIVNGVGTAITKTANAIVDVGKKVLDVVLAVPKMAVEIIGGVAEVAKETLIAGVKVIGEGLTGVIKASFAVVEGAAKGVGAVIKGVGKLAEGAFRGVGKLAEGLLVGIGKGISGVISVVGEIGKTAVQVTGAIAEGVTSIVTTTLGSVTKLATKLIGGVTDLITSAGSALFSLAVSPFKFLSNFGKGLILRSSHVIVDGGRLDTIKNIERVEKILVLEKTGTEGEETSFWESMKTRFGLGTVIEEKEEAQTGPEQPKEKPGEPAEEQQSEKKEESKKTSEVAEETGKKSEEKKEEKPGTVAEPKKEEPKKESPGKPATTNVTSDMARSGLISPTSGPVQRTAAVTKAIAEANSEKELMKTNELQQTSWLEKIYKKAQERTGMFGKLLKWLAGAALLLWGWFGKLKNAFLATALGKILKNALGDIGKNISVSVENGLKKTLGELVESVGKRISSIFGHTIAGIPKLIMGGIALKFGGFLDGVKKKIGGFIDNLAVRLGLKKVAEEGVESAGKTAAKALADTSPKLLLNAASEAAMKEETKRLASQISAEELSKMTSKDIAAKFFSGSKEETQAIYTQLMQRFHPDKFVSDPSKIKMAENIATNINVARDTVIKDIPHANFGGAVAGNVSTTNAAADDIAKQVPKWLEAAKEALFGVEKAVCNATGKNIQFAERLWSVIAKICNPGILAKNASKLAAAYAKSIAKATIGKVPVITALMVGYNTISGIQDAANYFKINSEAVTAVMKICVIIVKCIFDIPFTPWVILSALLMIISSLFGINIRGWLSQELYKILVDSKSVQELEAEQAKFVEEARAAGYVKKDIFGNEVVDVDRYNEEVNKTFFDQHIWEPGKKAVNDFKNWAAPKIENAKKFIGESWESAKTFVSSIPEKWSNFKETVSKSVTPVVDSVIETKNNIWAWAFGHNDENGEHIPGFFDDPLGNIALGIKDFTIDFLSDGMPKDKAESIVNNLSSGILTDEAKQARKELVSGLIGVSSDKISGVFSDISKWAGDKLSWVASGFAKTFGLDYDEEHGFGISDWVFGYNDENGNYVPGFFANSKAFISKGFESIIASILNTTPEELETGMTEHGPAMFITSKILGVEVERVKKSKNMQYIRSIWLKVIGGFDEIEGKEYPSIIEQMGNAVDAFKKVFEEINWKEELIGTKYAPKGLGLFIYKFESWAEDIGDWWNTNFMPRWNKGMETWENFDFVRDCLLGTKENPKGFGEFVFSAEKYFGDWWNNNFMPRWNKGMETWENFDFVRDCLLGTKENPKGFGEFVYPLSESASNTGIAIGNLLDSFLDGLSKGISEIPDKFSKFIEDTFTSLSGYIGDSFKLFWGSLTKLILGEDHYNADVQQIADKYEAQEEYKNKAFSDVIKPQEYKFRGSGNERYTMSDSNYANKTYGYGTYEDTACAPVTMSNILGINPETAANYALSGGYRVPGGTTEDYLPSIANAVGVSSTKLNSVGDVRTAGKLGMKIAVGGVGKDFTDAGHYSEAIPGDTGVYIKDSRGPEYDKSIDYNTFSKEVKTAYAFSGSGIGDNINLPDFSSVDISRGNLLKQYTGVIFDWFASGTFFGPLVDKFIESFDLVIKEKLNDFSYWLFGTDYDSSPMGYVRDIVTSGINSVIGIAEDPKKITGILEKFNNWMIEGTSKVIDWMFMDIPDKVGLIVNTVNSGIDWLFGKKETDGSRKGGVVKKFETFMLDGIGKINNWLFSNIPGGNLIVDAAKSATDWIFGKENNGIRQGGVFDNLYKFIESKISSLGEWIIGKIPGGSLIVDTIRNSLPKSIEEFGSNMVKGLNERWEEFKKKAFDFNNLNLKDLFKTGIKAVADKLIGSGTGDKLFKGSGDENVDDEIVKKEFNLKLSNKVEIDKLKELRKLQSKTVKMHSLPDPQEGYPTFTGSGTDDKKSEKKEEKISNIAEVSKEELDPEAPKGLPYFKQWDSRWGNKDYGGNTFTNSACGPTSMAMLSTWATGKIITPEEAAKWSVDNNFRKPGSGTEWGYFPSYAKALGYEMIPSDKSEDIWKAVNAGLPVITSVEGGKFNTSGRGHFIVVAGKRKDDSIIVYDPNKFYAKDKFKEEEVNSNSKQNWVPKGVDSKITNNSIDNQNVTTSNVSSSGGKWSGKTIFDLASAFMEGFTTGKSNNTESVVDNASSNTTSNNITVKADKGKGLNDATGTAISRNTNRDKTEGVVFHHMGAVSNGEPLDVDWSADYVTKNIHIGGSGIPNGCGYHFVIRKNGDIEKGRVVDEQGAHALHDNGKPSNLDNTNSIGVNLSGTFYGQYHPTQAQLDSASHLLADLHAKYNFPLDKEHVIGHIETSNTECPGNLKDKIPNVIESAKGMVGSGNGDEFIGLGNKMQMRRQSGKECTIESTRAMTLAYQNKEVNPTFNGTNWWAGIMDSYSQETQFGNSDDQRSKFEGFVGNWFKDKPNNPLFLYQTGGDGSGGSHPLNRGSGDHATVIGRKLSNGKYQVYDSYNENSNTVPKIHNLDLNQIFDPTAKGGTAQSGMPSGAGNTLWVPKINPSSDITEWQGEGQSAEVGNEDGSAVSSTNQSSNTGITVSKKPTTETEVFYKYLHELGVAAKMGINGEKYTVDDWNKADLVSSSGSSDSSDKFNSASSQPSGEKADGTDNMSEKDIWKWFRAKGYSPEATAGIMARLKQEHGYSPKYARFQNSGGEVGGFGMFQWTYDNGEGYNWPDPLGADKEYIYNNFGDRRLVMYMKWVDENNRGNYESNINQLDYFYDVDQYHPDQILFAKTSEQRSGYPRKVPSISGWKPENMNTMDKDMAFEKFGMHYERGIYDKRAKNFPTEIYDEFKGSGTGDKFLKLNKDNLFVGSGWKSSLIQWIAKGLVSKETADEIGAKLEGYPNLQKALKFVDNFDPFSLLTMPFESLFRLDEDIRTGKIDPSKINQEIIDSYSNGQYYGNGEGSKVDWRQAGAKIAIAWLLDQRRRQIIEKARKEKDKNKRMFDLLSPSEQAFIRYEQRKHGRTKQGYGDIFGYSKWFRKSNKDDKRIIVTSEKKDDIKSTKLIPTEEDKQMFDLDRKSTIERDELGNIIGLDIPEYNIITKDDSIAVVKAKMKAQEDQYYRRNEFVGSGNAGIDLKQTGAKIAIAWLLDQRRKQIIEKAKKEKDKNKKMTELLSKPEQAFIRYEQRKHGKTKQGYGDIFGYSKWFRKSENQDKKIIVTPDKNDNIESPKINFSKNDETMIDFDWKSTIERDELGNIKNMNIPEYNIITKDDSIAVVKAKMKVQEDQYVKDKVWMKKLIDNQKEKSEIKPVEKPGNISEKQEKKNESESVKETKNDEIDWKGKNFVQVAIGKLIKKGRNKNNKSGDIAEIPKFASKDDIYKRYGLDKLKGDKATKEDIDYVVKTLGIEFDSLQNVKGINIPDELKIKDFNDPDKYKKQYIQLQKYFELGGKTPEGKTLDDLIKEPFKKGEKLDKPAKETNKTYNPIAEKREKINKPPEFTKETPDKTETSPTIAGRVNEEVRDNHMMEEARKITMQQEEENNKQIWNRMVDLLQIIAGNTSGINSGFESLIKKESGSVLFERPRENTRPQNTRFPMVNMSVNNNTLKERTGYETENTELRNSWENQLKIASAEGLKRIA